MLATGPMVHGFNPAEDIRFLMAIKIHSKTSFRGAFGPYKIFKNIKDPYSMKRDTFRLNSVISWQVSSCFATRCLLVTARELWWVNQE
jgi:hypothetical protein